MCKCGLFSGVSLLHQQHWDNVSEVKGQGLRVTPQSSALAFSSVMNNRQQLDGGRVTHVQNTHTHTRAHSKNTHTHGFCQRVYLLPNPSHTLLRKGQSFTSQSKMPVSARVSTDTQQTERLPFSSGRVLLNAGLGGRHLPAIINYTFLLRISRGEQLTAKPGALKQRHR